MFFSKKGQLRKTGDEQLLHTFYEVKEALARKKAIVGKSVEPSEQVLYELALTEAKYFFLLKEAKKRNVSMKSLK
ncbi:YaaL family protein [Fictibacillus sp. Mic-4]|uniref:YaaL family protein n=1 Tax=Fictibacillus TaxID=1329200 RepID=UPI00041E25EA|nr:YaaL family protein [Fictibacillus gelatini]